MFNRVMLIGFAGKDPEIGTTAGGNKYARLSLATSESWKDKASGERRERTDWHNVVVWSETLVTLCEKHIRKGSKLFVIGKNQNRSWEKDGIKHYATDVVVQGFNAELLLLDKREGGSFTPPPDDPDGFVARGSYDDETFQ